ncbi:cysteine-rich CWC family protein [Panacibacter sp. DH6]|uniref:Cysteine-rich CWC family protein n=1 Tax=Panacibacter microcysteis TaxID=2793269 RepID=A0A931E725_9BACT|nr:cysteine-rich CWC family protein [Panacibacter microcysteis]MBG9376268.1 cysteine-rich CWC family protein [Panacibacter microcysteis]
MPKHEPKVCPRCNNEFECRAGDITNCQCSAVALTVEEQAFIEDRYNDCLCTGCLHALKNRYVFFKEKFLGR